MNIKVTFSESNNAELPVVFSESDQSIDADFGKVQTVNIGLSAYQIAVKNGFEGSEEEWLESLQGEDGQDGEDGYTPIKGVDYFDGKDGRDGYTPIKGVDYFDGQDGYTPVKGVDYFDGQNGQPGKDGVNGKDGYTPRKGIDYFDGKDGADGFSPVVAVEDIDGGHRVTITDKNGANAFDVMDGKDGQGGGGGVTSWNDLTDKPFGGEISYDWVSVANGTYNKVSSGTATDTWRIPISSFTPIVGTTYKIEAKDPMLGSFGKKTITAEAKQTTKNGIPYVIIGDEGSELYYLAVLTGSGGTVYYTGTISIAASAWIYEEQAVGTNIIPLDTMYLPEEVVLEEELDQILIAFEEFILQNFQTEEQVTELINNALGVIENGTY